MTKTATQIAALTIHSIRAALIAVPGERPNSRALELYHAIECDDVLELVDHALPGLANYDHRGNWVGSVSHENGWTA
jgi:hypothetical protein